MCDYKKGKHMKKVEEFSTSSSFFKVYSDEDSDVLQFVKDIQDNGVHINYIEAMESVESDMQTVNGMCMNPAEFEQKYAGIELRGMELSYHIDCVYNQIPVRFTIGSSTKNIVMSSPEQSLELDRILMQKE